MSITLEQFSSELADLVDAAAPSVVRVEARRRVPASGIAWSEDGLIVSADHVVEFDEDIAIGLDDGSEVSATVVGRDASTDLIVLRTEASGLAAARWVAPDDLRVGALALAVGRPYRAVQTSMGTVSAAGDAWRTRTGGRVDRYIRPDVTMYPGFSGGALVSANGAFVGLNTSALLRDSSVTIPSTTLKRTVDTILMHGRVPRGYLGIGVQPVRLSTALVDTAGTEVGLMIMSVEQGGPAESAGVRQGDILIAVNNGAITSIADLRAALSLQEPNSQAILRIVRSNEILDVAADVELR